MIMQPSDHMDQPTDLSATSGSMNAALPPPPYSFSANTADKHSFATNAASVDKRPPTSPFGAAFSGDSAAYCSPPPPAYLEQRQLADTSREEDEGKIDIYIDR